MNTPLALNQNAKAEADWMSVPPVFIVGCGRSGTTLLRLMLTAHPTISISSEGAYVGALRRKHSSRGDLSNPVNLRALYQDLQPEIEYEKFLNAPDFEQFTEWVTQFGASVRSIITFYGTWEARVLGKRVLTWWGDNAPYHVYSIPFFNELFPNCKVLFMVRDPRDVYASRRTGFGFDQSNLDWMIGQWEKSLLDGLSAGVDLGPSRFKIVRYEKLVSEPREQLHEICSFLGVEYANEMLAYYESEPARVIAQKSHHTNLLKPVFNTSVGRYRQVLSQEEIETIEKGLTTPMTHLGYLTYEEWEAKS